MCQVPGCGLPRPRWKRPLHQFPVAIRAAPPPGEVLLCHNSVVHVGVERAITRPAGPPLGFPPNRDEFPRQVLHRQQSARYRANWTYWFGRAGALRNTPHPRIPATFQAHVSSGIIGTFAEVPAMNLRSSSLHGKGPFTRLGVSNDGVARDATLCRPIERESTPHP